MALRDRLPPCRLLKKGVIGNIDSTVVLQQPKIAAMIPAMISSLSGTLGIDPGLISVKAKTSEKLGFIGREEGVSAYAVALLM